MAQENDLILIYYEDQPVSFARIETIEPDVRKDWYHVKLLLLQIPVQTVTWILRDVYINGGEFTMGGNRIRFEKIEAPPEEGAEKTTPPGEPEEGETGQKAPAGKEGKVVSLWDREPKKDK